MNILIVDSDREFRERLVLDLEAQLADALIMEYDPVAYGPPSSDFDWSVYDVMLLGANDGDEHIGWPWFAPDAQLSRFPGVILLSTGSEAVISEQAAEIFASEYLHKADVEARSLVELAALVKQNRAKYGRSGTPGISKKVEANAGKAGAGRKPVEGPPERLVSGYQLLDLLGEGPVSRVFLAAPDSGGDLVALKVLKTDILDSPEVLLRFIQEADLIASIESPRVVTVLEQGFTDESGFLAMEYLSGGTLRRRIKFGIEPGDAVRYVLHLAEGAAAIHAAGIVHRDLNPSTIIFRSDNTPAIADFGWSKALCQDLELTVTGQLVGVPEYSSPEQGMGEKLDHRSDIYSVGVILFEMLTGQPPFEGRTAPAVFRQHLQSPVPKLKRELARLQPILETSLAKDPDARYDDMGRFQAALQEFAP